MGNRTAMTVALAAIALLPGAYLPAQEALPGTDGAVLWVENCLDCHRPDNFLSSQPDEEAVNDLVDRIDYQIYEPGSPMNFLSKLMFSDLLETARFAIFGRHGKNWMEGEHGREARLFGVENCNRCHGGGSTYFREAPPDCYSCHS